MAGEMRTACVPQQAVGIQSADCRAVWQPSRSVCSHEAILSEMFENALAAGIALALDEFEAKLIHIEHVQGVLNVESDAHIRLSQGASILGSLVNATCLPVPPRDDAFTESN